MKQKVLIVRLGIPRLQAGEDVKKYVKIGGRAFLEPIIEGYAPIEITQNINFTIKGIAVYKGYIGDVI